MTLEDELTRYYMNQAGSGMGEFYSGPIYQRGYGIGSYLGGLFRSILPLLRRGSIAVGKEIFNSGTKFFNDVENNVEPRTAFNARSAEAFDNLKRKAMFGEGFIPDGNRRKRQLGPARRPVKTKRRKIVKKKKRVVKKRKTVKRKKYHSDIFH